MNEDNILYPEQLVQDDNSVSEPVQDDTSQTLEQGTAADLEIDLGENESSASVPQIVLPEYSYDNPLPVVVVEEEQELEQVEVFALSGKYYGTISETYLDYFEGIVQKLKPDEHYVIWRSGQNAYNMCYGKDIELEGSYFSGIATCVSIFRDADNYSNNWYVQFTDDTLELSATDLFVYSDLGMYPTVERGMKHGEGLALLVAVAVATVFMLCHCIFDYIVKHVYRK